MPVPRKTSLDSSSCESLDSSSSACKSGSTPTLPKAILPSIEMPPETNALVASLVVKVASAMAIDGQELPDE